MSCDPEEFRPADLVISGGPVIDGLVRRKDGTYGFRVFIECEARTPDGRLARISRHLWAEVNEVIGRKRKAEAALRPTG